MLLPRACMALILLFLLATCRYPQDMEGTLERVSGGVLEAGLVPAEPWASWENGRASGVEVELVEAFARSLDAQVRWHPASENDVLEALHLGRLDLVVGGLKQSNPWGGKVTFTRDYYRVSRIVAAPEKLRLDSLEGHHVLVDPASPDAARVEQRGGVPVFPSAADKETGTGAILQAVPHWRLDDQLFATGIELAKEKHVMAVPKGENAWILRLEKFLLSRRGEIDDMLRRAAR